MTAQAMSPPLEIGGRGVLPGSSLRGMVRTVMEIATFSHLGRINDHRHFGDRELMTLPANEIQAGWLRYCEKKDKWTLTVAARAGRIYPVPFAEVFNYIGPILCPACLASNERSPKTRILQCSSRQLAINERSPKARTL